MITVYLNEATLQLEPVGENGWQLNVIFLNENREDVNLIYENKEHALISLNYYVNKIFSERY